MTEGLEALEAGLIAQQPTVERTAEALLVAGESDLARRYLTYYSHTEALNGLRPAESTAD